MPKAQYWDEFDAQVADIQMIGWHAGHRRFGQLLRVPAHVPQQGNRPRPVQLAATTATPSWTRLIEQSLVETDPAKRAKLLQDAEKMAYDDAAFVPFHWQNLSWAGKKNVDIAPIVNVMNFPYFGDLVVK